MIRPDGLIEVPMQNTIGQQFLCEGGFPVTRFPSSAVLSHCNVENEAPKKFSDNKNMTLITNQTSQTKGPAAAHSLSVPLQASPPVPLYGLPWFLCALSLLPKAFFQQTYPYFLAAEFHPIFSSSQLQLFFGSPVVLRPKQKNNHMP